MQDLWIVFTLCLVTKSRLIHAYRPCHGWGSYFPASYQRGPGSTPGQAMWHLRWIKWQWKRYLSEYLCFPLPASFQQFSALIASSVTDITEPKQLPTASLRQTPLASSTSLHRGLYLCHSKLYCVCYTHWARRKNYLKSNFSHPLIYMTDVKFQEHAVILF